MKKENLSLLEKELKDEYKQNCNKINEIDLKLDIFKFNNFTSKLIYYIISAYIIFFILDIVLVPNIYNVVPFNFVSTLMVVSSLIPGLVIGKILEKVLGVKKALKVFSNAKTWEERDLEEVKYKIQRKKFIRYNRIISSILKKIETDAQVIENTYSKYGLVKIFDDESDTDKCLYEDYKKMDYLIEKKFLIDNFLPIRDKVQRIGWYIIMGCFFGSIAAVTWGIPSIDVIRNVNYSWINFSIFNIFIPFIGGFVLSSIYLSKKYRIDKKVFDSLNSELGDKSLSKVCEFEKEKDVEKELEEVFKNICFIRSSLVISKMEEYCFSKKSEKNNDKVNKYSYRFKPKNTEDKINELISERDSKLGYKRLRKKDNN